MNPKEEKKTYFGSIDYFKYKSFHKREKNFLHYLRVDFGIIGLGFRALSLLASPLPFVVRLWIK
jgi:5-hydroxyisourate hydrolase-like protein (transthyretin family)